MNVDHLKLINSIEKISSNKNYNVINKLNETIHIIAIINYSCETLNAIALIK